MLVKTKVWCCAFGILSLALAARGEEPAAKGAAAPDRPSFAATTDQPVTLRYKPEAGQKVKFHADTTMVIGAPMDESGQKMKMGMDMKIDGGYDIASVATSGDFNVRTTINRIVMSVTGPQEFTVDTEKPATEGMESTAVKPLEAMVKVPVTAKISPTGKTEDVDIKALIKSIEKTGTPGAADSLKESGAEWLRSSFAPLPEKPVKQGDIFDAGEMIKKMPQGEVNLKLRYEVLSVSADKKQALLRPKADIKLVPNPKASVSIALDSSSMDGWLLFDIEKGVVAQSKTNLKMAMKIGMGPKTVPMDMDMTSNYKATP